MLTSRYVMEDVMQVSTTEPQERGSTASTEDTQTRVARPTRAKRRRLSPEQAGEVARLYAEGSTATSAIRARFGIGESSLYRILQRQGIPLRGRTPVSPEAGPEPSPGSRQQRRRGSRATRDRGGASGSVRPPAAGAARNGGVRGRFRVQFVGETIVEAQDIRDALRQAESLGATEITAVTREA
jgi:transposase-like protein